MEEVEEVEEEEEDAAVDLEVETISSLPLDSGTRDTEHQGKEHRWGWFSITEGAAEGDRLEEERRGRGTIVEEEEEDETSEVGEEEEMVEGAGVGVGVLRGETRGIVGIGMIGGRGNEEEEEEEIATGRGRVTGIEIGTKDDLQWFFEKTYSCG